MSKSKNKNRSEVEYLKGQVKRLEKELKYFKKRSHFFESPIEEIQEEVNDIRINQCPQCRHPTLEEYDFTFAVLKRCQCGYELRQKKKN